MPSSTSAPWLRFYGDTPATIDYPDCSMYCLVAESAAKYPQHIAYIFQGKQTSYGDFLQRIDSAARGLYAMGIRKGDRVTICRPNCPQTLHCLYGLNRIGAVANLVHPLSAPQEIAFYLQRSHSKAILTLDQFYGKVAAVTPKDVTILVAKIADALPFPLNILYPHTKGGRHPLPKTGYTLWQHMLCAGTDILELPEEDGKADDPAVILYSGGTTGKPKGVLLSNRNFNAQALQTIAASGFGSIAGMKMLAILPNFHGFGLGVGIHTPLLGGGTCILVPQFSIDIYAKLLRQYRPELIPGVPTLFEALLRCKGLKSADLSFLKGIFCGGDRLPLPLREKVNAFLQEHGCQEQIREGYGATECVAASCLTPRKLYRKGSIGIPFPDTFYKIVHQDTTQELEMDTGIGEICISGPTVMLGYLDEPEETAQALRIHDDGRLWLHTGDLGRMDSEGFVYFVHRIKRMIVSSGYNVYPSQLEAAFDLHEKVACSCCIGVPDAYRGQKVVAYIVPEAGIAPSEALKQELLSHISNYCAKYALPREIIFRTELPRTPLGKVDYRALEEENT